VPPGYLPGGCGGSICRVMPVGGGVQVQVRVRARFKFSGSSN